MKKICGNCKRELVTSEHFYSNGNGSPMSICKSCHKKAVAIRKAKRRAGAKEYLCGASPKIEHQCSGQRVITRENVLQSFTVIERMLLSSGLQYMVGRITADLIRFLSEGTVMDNVESAEAVVEAAKGHSFFLEKTAEDLETCIRFYKAFSGVERDIKIDTSRDF